MLGLSRAERQRYTTKAGLLSPQRHERQGGFRPELRTCENGEDLLLSALDVKGEAVQTWLLLLRHSGSCPSVNEPGE